jgi:hypothetical protein
VPFTTTYDLLIDPASGGGANVTPGCGFRTYNLPTNNGGTFYVSDNYCIASQFIFTASGTTINTQSVKFSSYIPATLPGTPANYEVTFTYTGTDTTSNKAASGTGVLYLQIGSTGGRHPKPFYTVYGGSFTVTE